MATAGADMEGIKTLDEAIPFQDFATLLEKVSNSANVVEKMNRLSNYLKMFREKFLELHATLDSNASSGGDSIFSIIRLLYPSADRKRASYNFKSPALSKMFAKILGLDKNSADGRKLIEYKEPIKAGFGAADLGSTVFTILEKRISHSHQESSKGKGPKLHELHKVLDQLARDRNANDKEAVTQEKQIKILQGFVRKLTPIEGKWLVRILLKNLFIDLKKQQLFKLIHPKAAEMINTLDLEAVCKKLNNPSASLTATEVSDLILFSFFKPMLCTRLDKIDEKQKDYEDADNEASTSRGTRSKETKKSNEQVVRLPTPPFILETKWDGERFQVHYEYSDNSKLSEEQKHKFKYFSRNGYDYTTSFNESLSLRLVKQFVQDPQVKSFILDGEMMAWNKDSRSFTQKSGNIDVKTLSGNNQKHCPLFVAFDVVYYNGQALHNKPLTERIEYLKDVLIPEESTCQFSEQTVVVDRSSVTDALNDAIDKLEEGLVVKAMNSVYEPGKRASNWLKIKPEYIEGHAVDDLDLLIIGAYYSDSLLRRGDITNFLVGLVGDKKNDFYPVATIGFGRLSYQARQELLSNLREVFVKEEIPSVKYGRRKKPDLFVDPKRSVVIQVKASEIIDSKEYELGYSLRFPRAVKIRLDKQWDDSMSVAEFTQLRRSCEGKLAKKSNNRGPPWFNRKPKSAQDQPIKDSSDDEAQSKPGINIKLASPKKSIIDRIIPLLPKAGAATARPKSSIFSGCVFCIIAIDSWKNEITQLVKGHGAEIVQNPTTDTMYILAEKESIRIKNYERNGSWDITNGRTWIDKCISAGKVVEILPEDLFFAKESTKKSFLIDYDKYGDSFTKPSSLQDVKALIKDVIEQDQQNNDPKEQLQAMKRQMNDELFPLPSDTKGSKLSKWSFFSDCKIAFRGHHTTQDSLSSRIEFYGGEVAEDETENGVTHIVLGSGIFGTSPPKGEIKNSTFLVNQKWLSDSLTKKEVLSEVLYLV